MDLYTIYDYERLPLSIEEESLWIVENTKPFFDVSNIPGQCIFELYKPSESLVEWVASDLNPFGKEYVPYIQRMRFGDKLKPHIDDGYDEQNNIRPRDHAINYLLSESGPITQWYDNVNPESAHNSIVFPTRTWHKIKTDTLHGVINISNPRIAITMIKT